MIKRLINFLRPIITDDQIQSTVLSYIVYGVFTVVALAMSIINIVTHKTMLLTATALFCILCLVNFILSTRSEKGRNIAKLLFGIEALLLFAFFIVTGGTDLFSIIWVLILPMLGLFFFGIPMGSLFCGIIFIFMILCFFLPPLRQFCIAMGGDYGLTFRMRFPMVFIASFSASFLLEVLRATVIQEMRHLQEEYQVLYSHDALTGLYNRHGMFEVYQKLLASDMDKLAVAILDIDYFKNINDSYGHMTGDAVLRELSDLIRESLPETAHACRWGGEEFAIISPYTEDAASHAEQLLETIRDHLFCPYSSKIRITVSIGIAHASGISGYSDIEKLMSQADKNLYQAKESGRNRIIS